MATFDITTNEQDGRTVNVGQSVEFSFTATNITSAPVEASVDVAWVTGSGGAAWAKIKEGSPLSFAPKQSRTLTAVIQPPEKVDDNAIDTLHRFRLMLVNLADGSGERTESPAVAVRVEAPQPSQPTWLIPVIAAVLVAVLGIVAYFVLAPRSVEFSLTASTGPLTAQLAVDAVEKGTVLQKVVVKWGDSSDPIEVTRFDGDPPQGKAAHEYASAGQFTIEATAVDGDGNSTTKSTSVQIPNADAPTVKLVASKTSGLAPLTIKLQAQATGRVTAYAWSLGDGTNSADQNVTHEFKKAGKYSVSLTATGPGGSSSKVVTIDVGDKPPSPVFAEDAVDSCLAVYSQYGACDWGHWSDMYQQCKLQLFKPLDDAQVVARVKSGECNTNFRAFSTWAKARLPRFYRAPGGTNCPSAHVIRAESLCRSAAASLSVRYERAVNQSNDRPSGCFWDQNSRVYFNQNLNARVSWKGVGGLCSRS